MAHTGNVRSFIWNHFLKLDKGKAQCRICMETYAFSRGSTSNLKRHFKLKHRATHLAGAEQSPLPCPPKMECESSRETSASPTGAAVPSPTRTETSPTRTAAPSPTRPGASPARADAAPSPTRSDAASPPRAAAPSPTRSETSPSRSALRTWSSIWDHFNKHPKGGECRHCLTVYAHSAGSTSNLKRHLSLRHTKIPSVAQLLARLAQKRDASGPHEPFAANRPKCVIWNHFIQLEKGKKARCRYCSNVYAFTRGSTSNLKRHLKAKHPMSALKVKQSFAHTAIKVEDGASEAVPTRRVGTKKRSPVWDHFIRFPMGVAKCRNCRMVYKYDMGTTANLKRHIGRCHRRYPYETQRSATSSPVSELGIEAEPASSEPESEPETKLETKHSPIAFTIEAEPASESESEAEDAKLTRSRQRTASAETEPVEHFLRQPLTSETSDLLDQTLLDVLCKDSVPFDLLESENFKKFVHTLNPMYNLPAKKQMSNSVLSVIYAEAVENVEDRLSSATSIALTCEGWASVGNTHYVAVTGHFLDKHSKISSNLLECSEVSNPRSAKHITTRVKASIERYKLQGKVVAIVTDSAADGKVAVSDLKMTHVTCFAHTLNLIVESAISDSIKSTIDEVRRIVRHFKSIPNGAETLRTTQHRLFQAEVKLKLDTPARCNATYDMLNRFLQNKVSLLVCLDTLGITTSLGNVDWDIIEQALSALKYFNSAANVVSAERHVMISHVGFLSSVLLQKTANLANNPLILDEVQFFVSLLTQGLQERLEDFFCSELVAKAMLLDPRIKKLGFQNGLLSYKEAHDAIVIDLIPLQTPSVDELQSVTTGVANEDVDMLFGDVLGANVTRPTETPRQMALDELERYMNMNNIELDKDPLTWWKVHNAKFPSLFALAKAILCIPGTAAPGERLFSKAGQSYCEKRARLSPKHLKEILFVQQNTAR